MAQVVILSDITQRDSLGGSRYAGAYAAAASVRAAGFSCDVIDWFTDIPDLFVYLRSFLGPETLAVCVATTFLMQSGAAKGRNRTEMAIRYFSGHLWFSDTQDLTDWFSRLRELARELSPHAKIVLGGAKVAQLYAEARKPDFPLAGLVDYAVLGNSERSFPALVRSIHDGHDGIGKELGSVRFVMSTGPLLYEGCPDARLQASDCIQPGESLPLEVSRGCVFNCKFCHYDKKQSIRKPLGELRDEIVRNHEMWGTTVYHFCDDCFNDGREKVESICGMLLALPFRVEWVSYARVDLAVKFPHTLDLMVESGARGLFFGIETFNHEAGRRAGKGVHPDKVKATLLDFRDRHSEDCMVQCSFIAGLPGETVETQESTFEWIMRERPMDFMTVGRLGMHEYDEELDREAIDYADYARNPAKYGLEEVRLGYWRHATMDSVVAAQLAAKAAAMWADLVGLPFVRFIWNYPVIRSMGYTWEQFKSMAREPSRAQEWEAEVRPRKEAWVRRYHQDLLTHKKVYNT